MSQHRIFVDGPLSSDQNLSLDGERAHYLGRVLRLKVGARLVVFSNGSDDYSATVTAVRKQQVDLQIGPATANLSASPLPTRLLQSLARGERMDIAIQKATELGVTIIQPIHSAFSVVKLSSERADRRRLHWQKIARGACEQCGRNTLPEIAPPMAFLDALSAADPAECRIILSPGAEVSFADLPAAVSGVDLLVGPEGGFSTDEIEQAQTAGFVAVTLGPRILRAETAAMTAMALAQSRWGDLQTPPGV